MPSTLTFSKRVSGVRFLARESRASRPTSLRSTDACALRLVSQASLSTVESVGVTIPRRRSSSKSALTRASPESCPRPSAPASGKARGTLLRRKRGSRRCARSLPRARGAEVGLREGMVAGQLPFVHVGQRREPGPLGLREQLARWHRCLLLAPSVGPSFAVCLSFAAPAGVGAATSYRTSTPPGPPMGLKKGRVGRPRLCAPLGTGAARTRPARRSAGRSGGTPERPASARGARATPTAGS